MKKKKKRKKYHHKTTFCLNDFIQYYYIFNDLDH